MGGEAGPLSPPWSQVKALASNLNIRLLIPSYFISSGCVEKSYSLAPLIRSSLWLLPCWHCSLGSAGFAPAQSWPWHCHRSQPPHFPWEKTDVHGRGKMSMGEDRCPFLTLLFLPALTHSVTCRCWVMVRKEGHSTKPPTQQGKPSNQLQAASHLPLGNLFTVPSLP